jgi:hypothetical protein
MKSNDFGKKTTKTNAKKRFKSGLRAGGGIGGVVGD